MKYVNLGKSGLKVSQIILGCMSYGVKRPADKWTWVLEEEEAMKHLKVSFKPWTRRENDLEMLHSFLLLKDPGPLIGRTLDTI